MIRASLVTAALLLAACQAEPAPDKAGTAQSPPAAAPTAAAKPRKVEEKSDVLEFSYSWPAEAAAIPGLNKQLEEELGRDRTEAQATAKEDKAGHSESGTSFFAHSFSKEWKLAGNTARLLSILGEVSTFTGGAHPNTDYDGAIWDREAGRLISLGELFAAGDRAISALSARYCKGLDEARAERRGEVLPPSPDDFSTACPSLADQTVVAADTNGNGRFDMLQIWLPPSVAGAYAEGGYQVDLKIDDKTLAALKPEYRASFER
jgi:hypothetical protein